jgi:hypothetical protein
MSEPNIKLFKFRDDFDRDTHITLCAASIEGIRDHLGKQWQDLLKPARQRDLRLREARNLVKHLIRVASESADFYRTVDFITRSAATTVEAARVANAGKALVGHLQPSSELTHEHMVPGEAVMRELLHAPAGMPLAEVLEPLTYRALVCKKSELHKLDSPDLRSALPWVGQTRLAGAPEKLARVQGTNALRCRWAFQRSDSSIGPGRPTKKSIRGLGFLK